MADTLIFDADLMLADKDYKRIISREDAEYFNGLPVKFDEQGYGKVVRPECESYLYPIKREHCLSQMSLF